jgi:DNA-binding transcriptional MerR regulator
MSEHLPSSELPPIPAKRYFTIGEVAELCGVKPHVLRYWEQEFTQLSPIKRRGNRRYYQHHEVMLIRHIRELLYEQGFTISGARNRLLSEGAGHTIVMDDTLLLTNEEVAEPTISSAEIKQELSEIIELLKF